MASDSTRQSLAEDLNVWMARADMTPRASSFISLAEEEIDRALRLPQQVKTVDVVVDDGEFDLPDDFLELIELSDSRGPLEPDERGIPGFVVEGDKLVFGEGYEGVPLTMRYYERFARLVNATDTNWLLQNHYSIYLFFTLASCADAIADDRRQAHFMNRATEGVVSLRKADARAGLAERQRPPAPGSGGRNAVPVETGNLPTGRRDRA